MASDISVGAQYVGPYEVKDAGDGKGQGAFATRDIRAGETILVDFTPIICKDTRNREDYLETVISLYSSVDESEKKAWNDLYEYYNTPRAQEYRTYYSQRQKEGKKFTPAQVSLYTHLALILNCNTYATSRNEMGLFIHASRFNHSVC
jgi:hypothetical protein